MMGRRDGPPRIVVGMLAWQRIRVLRTRPPARVEGERAGVFVSALEQAEQLMNAAADVGPAASPLLLFYAVSQAGRAIAAAHLDDPWRLSGHGLKLRATADPSGGLLRRVVKPDGGQATKGRTSLEHDLSPASNAALALDAVEARAALAGSARGAARQYSRSGVTRLHASSDRGLGSRSSNNAGDG